MKASELIKQLKKLVEKHGDLDVMEYWEYDYIDISGVEFVDETMEFGNRVKGFGLFVD